MLVILRRSCDVSEVPSICNCTLKKERERDRDKERDRDRERERAVQCIDV